MESACCSCCGESPQRGEALKIQLPYNWRCRPYQDIAYNYLARGGKRFVGVEHRRWGKDKMLLNATAVLAHKRTGVFWHLLPEAAQARKAIWEAVDEFKVQQTVRLWLPGRFGIPTTIRCSKVRTPLALTCRGRGNGSAWQRSLNFFSLPHGRKLSLGEVSYADQVFPGCQRAVPYR